MEQKKDTKDMEAVFVEIQNEKNLIKRSIAIQKISSDYFDYNFLKGKAKLENVDVKNTAIEILLRYFNGKFNAMDFYTIKIADKNISRRNKGCASRYIDNRFLSTSKTNGSNDYDYFYTNYKDIINLHTKYDEDISLSDMSTLETSLALAYIEADTNKKTKIFYDDNYEYLMKIKNFKYENIKVFAKSVLIKYCDEKLDKETVLQFCNSSNHNIRGFACSKFEDITFIKSDFSLLNSFLKTANKRLEKLIVVTIAGKCFSHIVNYLVLFQYYRAFVTNNECDGNDDHKNMTKIKNAILHTSVLKLDYNKLYDIFENSSCSKTADLAKTLILERFPDRLK